MTGFDWVTARNNCTAASEFKNLREAVIADMKTRIAQDDTLKHAIEYRDHGADKFAVRKQGSHEILFQRVDETIKIANIHQSGTERHLMTVTVGMNDRGECTLKRGDDELLPWQVRRKALEETLFWES